MKMSRKEPAWSPVAPFMSLAVLWTCTPQLCADI